MNENFLKEEGMEEQVQEVEKIKIGEEEYTQEELNKLVGLGKLGVELEEKWNTKLDRVVPEYTKATQENKTLKEALAKIPEPKQEEVALDDKEKIRQEAKIQLKELGYYSAEEVEKRAREIANEIFSGHQLVDKVDKTIFKQKEDGYPEVSREALLSFMNDNNLIDPELAYKIKFEKEIDSIKEKKLASIKPNGIVTNSTSTAGGKQPAPVKVTKANLGELIESYL